MKSYAAKRLYLAFVDCRVIAVASTLQVRFYLLRIS